MACERTGSIAMVGALVTSVYIAAPSFADEDRRPPDRERGQAVYRTRCAVCHGNAGNGDGPIARDLDPRPRDFTRGVYKIRSTPTGDPPHAEDLFETVTRGIPGSAMPSWAGLSKADRWDVVGVVMSFAEEVFSEAPIRIAVPAAPEPTPAILGRGAELYRALECQRCHGADGRGDGPSALDLLDSEGRQIRPCDMTRSSKHKSRGRPERLARVLMTGLDGTPMAALGEALAAEDLWALALYVRALSLSLSAAHDGP